MTETRFYICQTCGNLVGMIHSSGVKMVCCKKEMHPLVPGAVEASGEKHLPVLTRNGAGVTVTVGSVLHPMSEEHSIEWIYLETNLGGQRKRLSPTASPEANFALAEEEEPVAAYAYCNLHGLWKTEV